MPLVGDRVTSPLICEAEGVVLDDILHFAADGQFNIVGRRGRVVKIEDKRISLDEIEQRLLALDGICDAAALAVTRRGRQAIGVLLVLSDAARLHRDNGGKNAQESAWRRALRPCLEPVAVPRRHQGQPGAGGVDETRVGRRGAAVMRHQHDVGTQIGGAPAQQAMLDDFADEADGIDRERQAILCRCQAEMTDIDEGRTGEKRKEARHAEATDKG